MVGVVPAKVMVVPLAETSELVVLPTEATSVVDVNEMDEALAASSFTCHVPMIPAPVNGVLVSEPNVTAIVPFPCVSGARTVGRKFLR